MKKWGGPLVEALVEALIGERIVSNDSECRHFIGRVKPGGGGDKEEVMAASRPALGPDRPQAL
jgi:hypothetical protein